MKRTGDERYAWRYEVVETDYEEQTTFTAAECADCGALVASTDTHDEWHARVES